MNKLFWQAKVFFVCFFVLSVFIFLPVGVVTVGVANFFVVALASAVLLASINNMRIRLIAFAFRTESAVVLHAPFLLFAVEDLDRVVVLFACVVEVVLRPLAVHLRATANMAIARA